MLVNYEISHILIVAVFVGLIALAWSAYLIYQLTSINALIKKTRGRGVFSVAREGANNSASGSADGKSDGELNGKSGDRTKDNELKVSDSEYTRSNRKTNTRFARSNVLTNTVEIGRAHV